MGISPDTSQGDHGKPARKSGNLLHILGVGGGAVGGVFVGAANYDAFPIGVLLFLAIGAVVGAIVPWGGSFVFLAAIVAFVITAMTDNQATSIWMLCPLVGGGIGLVWTMVAWALRHNRQGGALSIDREAAAKAREDRNKLARISLGVGLIVGLLVGIMIGGPFLIAGPLLGAVVGVAMSAGLMLSDLSSRK